MAENMIELIDVEKYFGGVHALRGVSMQIPAGQVTAIIGDNGAGKSTLIKCLSGIHQPTTGQILVDGVPADIASPHASRELGIETVYQDLAVIDTLNVMQNLYLSREIRTGIWPFRLLNQRKMKAGAREMLARIGNTTLSLTQEVGGMSGGQRQAVAICRAVAWGAKTVIFDEPTAALGPNESAEVHRLIASLREQGITVILISHNFEEVMGLADVIWVMRQGRAIAKRKASETTGRELVTLLTGADIAAS
ncbi:ATP-binding cassette domain-containing protein [Arthrobacter burdickii]|jgi:ABC-type sugar transport system ATPase subunit|uniref:ATP-binding cassette domain-containing protein n=1 Tax=Arthrobacter burdickii TaxID=3035920 RepID=A0ABT8JWL7_9MICC|nr:ATP-binding cassette domain-containing protein [Arthrobacter burdickii]MDN4609469.1 ATP-binding cassette domain-containing protein [Arthrobacter burdickii]